MVKILTSHHKIWNIEKITISIIKEYLDNGRVVICLNNEGPCASSIGLYSLLDDICEKFNFSKKNIIIETCNFEETHSDYVIIKLKQHWINSTVNSFNQLEFEYQKNVTKNLFGCLYNVPSWDRLCLLSYIYFHTKNPSMLFCNGIWEGSKYNSYYLNDLVDFYPDQIFTVVDYLKTFPAGLLGDLTNGNKPVSIEDMLKVIPNYNDFFIDLVAETYTQGLSFFITEKTLRPILTLTPFIIQAPKSFLSTLKSDYGILTFDKWWDESYDNYDGSARIERIFKLIDYIDKFTINDRLEIYKEMQPTLSHNFKQLQTYVQKTNR